MVSKQYKKSLFIFKTSFVDTLVGNYCVMDPIAYNTAIRATESSIIGGHECVNKSINLFGGKLTERPNSSMNIITVEGSPINYNTQENTDSFVSLNENSDFNNKYVTISHQFTSGAINKNVTSPIEHLKTGVTITKFLPNYNNHQGKSNENLPSSVLTTEESSISHLIDSTNELEGDFTCSFVEQINPLMEQITYDICHHCQNSVTNLEDKLTWGSMIFCNDICLGSFQKLIGAFCAKCNAVVETKFLGKFSVTFAFGIKQFCSKACLEEYKKCVRKCVYCKEDVSDKQNILVPDGEYVRIFCSMLCINQWESQNNWKQCAVCNKFELVNFEVLLNYTEYKLCSDQCFAAFKFVNNMDAVECRFCRKYFDKSSINISINFGSKQIFCSIDCKKMFVSKLKEIVTCDYCKVKKYKYDMLKSMTKDKTILTVCSLNCLASYRASFISDQVKCFNCNGFIVSHFSTQSENRDMIFCSDECLSVFKTRALKKKLIIGKTSENNCPPSSEAEEPGNKSEDEKTDCVNFGEEGRGNVSVQVFPVMCSKEISVSPEMKSMGTQTDFVIKY